VFKIVGNDEGYEYKDALHKLIKQFMPFSQEKLGFDKPVTINLLSDPENAQNPLGKTAHYEPNNMNIGLFVVGRHPKDILRSLSHELVHHTQNCQGQFETGMDTGPGYAQDNEHLRKQEKQAYLLGNIYFRDWEDGIKQKQQENKQMNDNLINEITNLLVQEDDPPAAEQPQAGVLDTTVGGEDDGRDTAGYKKGAKDRDPKVGRELMRKMKAAAKSDPKAKGNWKDLPQDHPTRTAFRAWYAGEPVPGADAGGTETASAAGGSREKMQLTRQVNLLKNYRKRVDAAISSRVEKMKTMKESKQVNINKLVNEIMDVLCEDNNIEEYLGAGLHSDEVFEEEHDCTKTHGPGTTTGGKAGISHTIWEEKQEKLAEGTKGNIPPHWEPTKDPAGQGRTCYHDTKNDNKLRCTKAKKNENWHKGNKDQLLFEELTRKWTKKR
jgi:hypothetical protein